MALLRNCLVGIERWPCWISLEKERIELVSQGFKYGTMVTKKTNLVVFVITVKLLLAINISSSSRKTPERVEAIMTDSSSSLPGRSNELPPLRLFTLVLSNK